MTAPTGQAQLESWPRPRPDDVWDLIFTSGTTGTPKGVMVAHDNLLATMSAINRVLPPLEHRVVSVLPLSHLFEQAIGLIYALSVGADILYVRSRNPRILFEALRTHRVTSMIAVPQVLDLFWSAIEREADKSGRRALFDRLRRIARHLPYRLRRLIFRSVHRRLGGGLRLFVCSGAFLPPALQQAWEDLGVDRRPGLRQQRERLRDVHHARGPRARDRRPADAAGRAPGRRRRRGALPRPDPVQGLLARSRGDGPGRRRRRLVPHRRHRPSRSGRAADPERPDEGPDRAAERLQGLPGGPRERAPDRRRPRRDRHRDGARPDRGGRPPRRASAPTDAAAAKPIVDAAVRSANASLGPQQRIVGWRLWPEDDFPRTHTLKIRRDPIRAWAGGEPEAGRPGCPPRRPQPTQRAAVSSGR